MIETDIVYSYSTSKANLLNDYFADSSTLVDRPDGYAFPPQFIKCKARLSEVIFTPIKVYKVLKNLQTCKASGPDLLSNRMLKECAEVMADPLSNLFNKLMDRECFPAVWKRANVVPVHKKGNKQFKSNYRPISLLSSLGKVMERIVFDELYEYCDKKTFIDGKNAGFKKNDTTVNQLLLLTNKIYKTLGDGSDVLIYLKLLTGFITTAFCTN